MSRISTPEYFWSRAELIPFHECWEWVGANSGSQKYGILTYQGKRVKAHRLAWELANGSKIPPGKVVCHAERERNNRRGMGCQK